MYNTLTIIPATVTYYEAELVAKTGGSGWNVPGSAVLNTQNSYTPGHDTYGYDSTYAGYASLSGGAALIAHGEGVTKTTASFTFRGTGFDIVSRTGPQQGTIRVTVKNSHGDTVRTVSVINKGEKELYRLPVISVEGLPYETYTVEIGVYPAVTYPPGFESLNMGNEFCFDAIRVYGAAGENAEAQDAYKADGEYAPIITEIRDTLLDAENFGADGVNGSIFMDDFAEDKGWNIANYKDYGPNNEVYLAQGNAIAFKLENLGKLASLDIGAKSADGNPVGLQVTLRSVAAPGDAKTYNWALNTCTAMFYDLMGYLPEDLSEGVYVIITNPDDGILSLTDLKLVKEGLDAQAAAFSADFATFKVASCTLSPDGDVDSAALEQDTSMVLSGTAMTVTTSQNVVRLAVTDGNGLEIPVDATYADTADGQRVWTLVLRPVFLGEQELTVTGYDWAGNTGVSISDTINITY